MEVIHVILLAIIEGITEFLPVSSTGHLILASNILRIPPTDFTKSFELFIQLGAIMAVITLYWKTLLTSRWVHLVAGFIPTAVIGFIFYPVVKNYLLESTTVTTISLFVGGIILIVFEKIQKPKTKVLTWKNAFLIGLFQSISIIPGVSRAGATIIGGMLVGLARKQAVEFSFLLAVPTIAAATGYDLIKSAQTLSQLQTQFLIVGFITSWITAQITINLFLRFIKGNTFISFGVYRILLALTFWLLLL